MTFKRMMQVCLNGRVFSGSCFEYPGSKTGNYSCLLLLQNTWPYLLFLSEIVIFSIFGVQADTDAGRYTAFFTQKQNRFDGI